MNIFTTILLQKINDIKFKSTPKTLNSENNPFPSNYDNLW